WTPSCEKLTVGVIGEFIFASLLDEQLARRSAEGFDAGVGDQNALGDLEPPVVLPDAGHEMERHAGLEHGPVAGARAYRALAPVGRVAGADRVAAAAGFLDAVAAQ